MDMHDDSDMQLNADDLLATYDANCAVEPERVPFVGLSNLGNTCFFNSIVQMLFYCPGFKEQLSVVAKCIRAAVPHNGVTESQSTKDCCLSSGSEEKCQLVLELCDLFNEMRKNQLSLIDNSCEIVCDKDSLYTVRPVTLLTALRKVYPAFEPYAQQDAQECLRCILSILQDALCFVRDRRDLGKRESFVKSPGCKVYGGRKLDGAQASTAAERAQIENCDPNRSSAKQVSRSTNARKRGVRSILGRPLKLKLTADSHERKSNSKQEACTLIKPDVCSKTVEPGPASPPGPLSEVDTTGNTTQGSKGAGCFAKLKRHKNPAKVDDAPKKNVGAMCTSEKRLSVDDPPSSPPLKRSRLALSNGLKNFYKPITSNLPRPRSLIMSDKKRSYSVLKSEKRSGTNPFKVVPNIEDSKRKLVGDKRKLVSDNPTLSNPGDDFTRQKPSMGPVLSEKKIVSHMPLNVVEDTAENVNISDFIQDMFQGELVNEVRCMECENTLQRKEPFMDISLPVKDNGAVCTTECPNISSEQRLAQNKTCSVKWGLSEFTSREILEGENKYYCEHCRRYVEGERRIQFSGLPPILTLHLKRFTTSKPVAGGDAFCSTVSKINSSLNVPQQLCLNSWTASSCNNRFSGYTLFGLVIHSGITISSGHYLSYIRLDKSSTSLSGKGGLASDLSPYNGSWLEADDERTRIITQQELDTILSPPEAEGVARTPYLLFYRREAKA